jgi:hypothetical protein
VIQFNFYFGTLRFDGTANEIDYENYASYGECLPQYLSR